MQLLRLSALVASLAILPANAHTYVWSVWVNGVDQGSGNGVRHPAYNGPPSPSDPPSANNSGYANSPVRDLTKPEMKCNVMGEVPSNETIKVQPGDVVTLEWHHNNRTTADDIIATSHVGSGVVYISPDPPQSDSWIKIQEEGEITPGYWYSGGKLNDRQGKQDVQIPEDLAPGFYLLRSELLALHEADVSHAANPNRGIQIYISCVQLEVQGNGTTLLPSGVTFPGAYDYDTPGIVYNVYVTTEGQSYTIPGPTVWSGAASSPTPPAYGEPTGYTINQRWYTWIGDGFVTATEATTVTVGAGTATAAYPYTAVWPTTYVPPAQAIESIDASYLDIASPVQTTLPPRPF